MTGFEPATYRPPGDTYILFDIYWLLSIVS